MTLQCMMSYNVMKGESSSAQRLRVDSRPPLRRRASTKSAVEERDPELTAALVKCEVNLSVMSSEQLVLGGGGGGGGGVSAGAGAVGEPAGAAGSRDEALEIERLKELLLVHLDMITQQQDLIMARDRQIKALKSEKEALKCRLERMERRMSLLKQKGGGSTATPVATSPLLQQQQPQQQQQRVQGPENGSHVRSLSFSGSDHTPVSNKGIKRKNSQERQPATKRLAGTSSLAASVSGEQQPMGGGGDATNTTAAHAHHSPRRHQTQTTKSAFGVRHFTRSPFNPLGDGGHDSDTSGRTLSPGSQSQSRGRKPKEEEPERGILDNVKERLKPVLLPETNSEEYFHRTDRMYYVPWEVPLSPLSRISPKKVADEVRVPSFRIKHIQTGYSMEGTENLDDEIFAKRHQKPELEEKRRKRWDMQRMREQRLYEKLQGKKQTRIAPVQLKPGKAQDTEGPPESFIPELEDVRYIEICDNVPVSAFGYPVPQLEVSDFDLPDFDLDQRESDETKRSSGRKKR